MTTPSTTYVSFTEVNEWEGETWHFWIPVHGNEAELEKLATAIKEFKAIHGPNCGYSLDMDGAISESEVDVLVKHTSSGYMAEHNKCTGILTCPEINVSDIDSLDDPFYKGRIEDWIKTAGQ